MPSLKGALLLVIALFFNAPIVRAQTNTGQIQGVVKDQNGAVVPGVSVTATHVASNLKVERVTDESGLYLFPSLAVGEYTLGRGVGCMEQPYLGILRSNRHPR